MASGTTMVSESVAEAGARTRLRCWGDFAVSDAVTGADLRPRGRKARALLAFLALHPGKPISRERLTGLLWGDRAEEQARASLRQSIFELKAFTGAPRKLLTIDRDHITLDPAALVTDLDALGDAADRGALATLLDAIPEPDERLFADLDGLDSGFDDWLAIERVRQRDALIGLVAEAAEAAAAGGDRRGASALGARLRELGADAGEIPAPPLQRDRAPPPADATTPRAHGPAPDRWRVALLVALMLAAAVIAVGGWQFARNEPSSPITIAVLPFESLSSARDDAYFAEGLSEEILGQLARNPRFKVMGRTSAWSFKGQAIDAPTLGRKLDVAYLVEGSVRRGGDRVRVNVALVRASDGTRIWADRYDGTIDHLFAIQERIGGAVLERLRVSVAPRAARPATPSGEAYGLYIAARGLFRERDPRNYPAAMRMLRRAIRIDPNFAAAWATLANVAKSHAYYAPTNNAALHAQAVRYARRALVLDPELAEAHAALGMALGFSGAEARAHLERAVALDPNDAQSQFWLSNAYGVEGDYRRRLEALRRATAIDPFWPRGTSLAALAAWEMGYRDEARRYALRLKDPNPAAGFLCEYQLDMAAGDYSTIVTEALAARSMADKALAADMKAGFALLALGHPGPAGTLLRLPPDHWRLAIGGLPPSDAIRRIHARAQIDDQDNYFFPLAIRGLLNADRAAEIVALYDTGEGPLAELAVAEVSRQVLIADGPEMALALRAVGRASEADALLARIDRAIHHSFGLGPVPNWFYAAAARAWAAQGKRERALAALDAAVERGWHYAPGTPLPDIADMPAFKELRDDPRFERIRERLRAHIARERRELGTVTI